MDLTIQDLQLYLRDKYINKINDLDTDLFMKLTEEMGEVAEVLNIKSGRKSGNLININNDLAEELADIIHYTIAIASVNDIDLTKAIIEKDKKASIKYNRQMNLIDFLNKD